MWSSPLTTHSSQVCTSHIFCVTHIYSTMLVYNMLIIIVCIRCMLYIGMRTAFRRLVWRSVILDEGHRVKNEVCKIITIYRCIFISIICLIVCSLHFSTSIYVNYAKYAIVMRRARTCPRPVRHCGRASKSYSRAHR